MVAQGSSGGGGAPGAFWLSHSYTFERQQAEAPANTAIGGQPGMRLDIVCVALWCLLLAEHLGLSDEQIGDHAAPSTVGLPRPLLTAAFCTADCGPSCCIGHILPGPTRHQCRRDQHTERPHELEHLQGNIPTQPAGAYCHIQPQLPQCRAQRLERLLPAPSMSSMFALQAASSLQLTAAATCAIVSCVQAKVAGELKVFFYDTEAGATEIKSEVIPARSAPYALDVSNSACLAA